MKRKWWLEGRKAVVIRECPLAPSCERPTCGCCFHYRDYGRGRSGWCGIRGDTVNSDQEACEDFEVYHVRCRFVELKMGGRDRETRTR